MDRRGIFGAALLLLVVKTVPGHELTSTPRPYIHFSDVMNNPLIHGPDHIELALYKQRARILLGMLRVECPTQRVSRPKREIISEVGETQIEVEKVMYMGLTGMLVECRKGTSKPNLPTTSATTPTVTTTTTSRSTIKSTASPSTTTMTTMELSTTTSKLQPADCQSAMNLTESWRLDHNGSRIQPINGGYNCDPASMIGKGRPWFRFNGAAGQKMLDKCPARYSCGGVVGLWTDKTMPAEVGVETNIEVFGSWTSGCKQFTYIVLVMRCSTENSYDFIYKYIGRDPCNMSFCGVAVN